MNWKQHLAIGAVFLVLASIVCYVLDAYAGILHFDWLQVLIAWPLGLYCSVLPDIDHPRSKVFKFTFILAFIGIIFFVLVEFMLGILFIVVLLLLVMLLKHRGFTHKWYISIPIGILFALISASTIIGIHCFLAYLSHAGIEKTTKGD